MYATDVRCLSIRILSISILSAIRILSGIFEKRCPLSVCPAGQERDRAVRTFGVLVRRRLVRMSCSGHVDEQKSEWPRNTSYLTKKITANLTAVGPSGPRLVPYMVIWAIWGHLGIDLQVTIYRFCFNSCISRILKTDSIKIRLCQKLTFDNFK